MGSEGTDLNAESIPPKAIKLNVQTGEAETGLAVAHDPRGQPVRDGSVADGARNALIAATALLGLLTAPLLARAQDQAVAPAGLQQNLRFDRYSPLSTDEELLRRLSTPLQAELARRKLAASGQALAAQPIDLAAERFSLYAPASPPPGGYGLMVFIPPWSEARIPPQWIAVLDQSGVILVTPAQAGNDANVLGRRIPLAAIAARNVIDRYPVNPERVYVAGFSGGARVALRAAIAFPELFHGAVLNSGSDPLGGEGTAVPPRQLLYRFQETTRIDAATGGEDGAVVAKDVQSAGSLANWCVYNVSRRTIPFMGHDLAKPAVLADALRMLQSPIVPNPDRLLACRSALQGELSKGIERAQAAIDAGRPAEARKMILALDVRFGGFADDRVVTLAKDCRCGVLP